MVTIGNRTGGAVLGSTVHAPPGGRVAVRAGFALAALGVAAQAAIPASAGGADAVARIATLAVAAALCALRAVLVRPDRTAWVLLGAGLGCWTGGEAAWAALSAGGREPPVPSVADIGYLAFYPLALAGVAALMRARAGHRLSGGHVADAVAAALACGAVAFAVGGPALSGLPTPQVAVDVTYLLLDVLLVGVVACAVASAGLRERSWWLLGGALLLSAGVDVAWVVQDAGGYYVDGEILDVLWTVVPVLVAAAGWQKPVPVPRLRLDGWTVFALPIGSLAAALTVLAVRPPVPAGLLAVTAVTVLAVRGVAALRRDPVGQDAVTDDLTGLGNRRLLLRRLDAALAGDGPAHALVLLDLDRFKEVNDTLGHPVGDELLRRIGPRLARTTRAGETVARLGGDEFAVLLPGIGGEQDALRAARRVLAGLLGAFVIDGLELFVSASAGIALAPDHGTDSATLLRKADVAMYQSKRTRGGPQLYRVGTDPNSRTRLESATALRRAIGEGQLVCHYQPQVDVATGVPLGLEALARWDDPRRGLLPPGEFLELAEHAGLMGRLSDAVLHAALEDCRRWRDGLGHLRVAVNLSVSSLQDGRLPERVAAALGAAALPAAALTLEIADGGSLEDGEARRTLAALHEMGVRLALDDYGAGRSALGVLRDLPIDQLKLDGRLVGSVLGDRRGRAIVRHTVLLAHALTIEVVAEGVEDAPTLRALDELGCDYAQGYHIAAPLPAAAVADWIAPRVADRTAGAS